MLSYIAVGRSFFSRVIDTVSLGQGVEGWKGFYQSIRPTQMGLSVIIGQLSLLPLNSYYLSSFLWCLQKMQLGCLDMVEMMSPGERNGNNVSQCKLISYGLLTYSGID